MIRYLAILSIPVVLFAWTGCGEEQSGEDTSAQENGTPSSTTDSGSSAKKSNSEAAKGVDGTITATVDGQSKTWYVLSREMGGKLRSQSEWSSFGGSGMSVNLFGHASPDSMGSDQAFMLEFSTVISGDTATATEPGITYLVNDSIINLYNSDPPGKASVEITGYESEGDTITVSGTFSGTLAPNKEGSEPSKIEIEDGTFKAKVHEFKDDG